MLEQLQQKCQEKFLLNRISFNQSEVATLAVKEQFQGATSILVMHFIPPEEKTTYLKAIYDRLSPNGRLFLVDIMNSEVEQESEILRQAWFSYMQLAGLTEAEIKVEKQQLADDLHLISDAEIIKLMQAIGFQQVCIVSQGMTIKGFLAIK